MDGCSRNIDLVHFGTQKMPGKIGYCFKSGLAQYSSFIITMGLSFARYHLTRGDDPNFCSLLSLLRVFYKSLRPPRPKIQFRRKLAKTLIWTFAIKKLKKIAERLQKITFWYKLCLETFNLYSGKVDLYDLRGQNCKNTNLNFSAKNKVLQN